MQHFCRITEIAEIAYVRMRSGMEKEYSHRSLSIEGGIVK